MACSAVSCSSRTTKGGVKDPELSFHTFPKCPEIRREWIKAVRRDNWEPTKYSRLCSRHFDKSCYISGLSIKKLKTDAVPSIFEGYPVYYQPVAKKRKPPQRRDEILYITPRKKKKMQESDVITEDIPTTPRRAVRVHLELFFGAVRSMGGFNNNPSAKQFRAAYKKLLIHAEFKGCRKKLYTLRIHILNVTKKSNYVNTINKSLSKHRLIEELDEVTQNESVNNDDHCYLNDPSSLTEYVAEVIYYISGFVIKKFKNTLVCEDCLSALEGPKRNSLTSIKDNGGLIYPSDDVYYICKLREKVLRKSLISTHHSRINSKDVHTMIRDVILQTMHSSNYNNIFRCLNRHFLDFNFLEDHKYLLIKSICEKYLQLRIHYVMKNAVAEISVRNMYTKLILFKGH